MFDFSCLLWSLGTTGPDQRAGARRLRGLEQRARGAAAQSIRGLDQRARGAEARRAGAERAECGGSRAGAEWIFGGRRELGGSEIRQWRCSGHFIAPALSHKRQRYTRTATDHLRTCVRGSVKTALRNLNDPVRELIYFLIKPNDRQNNYF